MSNYAMTDMPVPDYERGKSTSEIAFLDEALENNGKALDALKAKLDPVLGPAYPTDGETSDKPMVSRLAEQRMRLQSQTNILYNLIDRLEV